MKRANFLLLGFAAALALGLGGLAWRDARRRAAAEQEAASAAAKIAALQARLDRARRASTPSAALHLKAAAARTRTSPTGGGDLDERLSRAVARWEKESEAREKDPQVQLAELVAYRARLSFEYARLYRQLGLSPAQIAEFETNILRVRERMSDLGTALREAGLSFNDPAVGKRFLGPMNEEFRRSQKQLLGESGFEQFSQFESMKPARDKAATFAGFALISNDSLNPEQIDQLARAISAAVPPNPATGSGLDWDAVDRAASGFLTPSQLQLWQNYEPASGGRRWSQFNATLTQARKSDPVLAKTGSS